MKRELIERLRDDWEMNCADNVPDAVAEIERLRAEVEALRADLRNARGQFEKAWPDAQRYRWLRNAAGRGAAGSIFDNFSGTAIDECIDAARAAREGRG